MALDLNILRARSSSAIGRVFAVATFFVSVSGVQAASASAEVRSILSDNCFACHGPDEAARKSGLRLDLPKDALKPAKSGKPAIVPGDPEDSELIRRITTADQDDFMPPVESGKRISPSQVETLKQWIRDGAKWETHWSFARIERPKLPKGNAMVARNEVDFFVNARLATEGIEPTSQADKSTLIRRVSFDLIGLPPTVEEIDEFLADESPAAYTKLVDRLLASERYGENMARYWLDAVRYADSHGYHLDTERDIWAYRDWVIKAFNDNMPFDRFTIEQIAGDLLPEPTLSQRVASGYNRCNLTTNEGGAIEEEYQAKSGFDRTETMGAVWLGLTLGCARCHTHKYDPISHKEYYGLYAFFNNFDGPVMDSNVRNSEPSLKLPTPDQTERKDWLERQIANVESELYKPNSQLDEDQQCWENEWRERLAAGWTNEAVVLSPWKVIGPLKLSSLRDGYERLYEPEKKVDFAQKLIGGFEEVKWEDKPHFADGTKNALVSEVYSVKGNGVFYLHRTLKVTEPFTATLRLRADDLFKVWINGELKGSRDKIEKPGDGPFGLGLNFGPGEHQLLVKVVNYEAKLCFFRFELDFDQPGVPPSRILALLGAKRELAVNEKRALQGYFRGQRSTRLQKFVRDAAQWRDEMEMIDKYTATTLIARERKERKDTFLLLRGEYDKKGEKVAPGVPAVLNPMSATTPVSRLGLAQWLVSPENPLTARVIVNRFWQQYFGTGIVKTSEDFGVQGEPPSHPELLDWLAAEFIASGWDVKALQRKIVLSSTYTQTSRATVGLVARDPENRLLARGPRFRLDAETIRDNALLISGQLVNLLGGPSAKPHEPPGLWEAVSHENRLRYVPDEGEGQFRRSVYTFWKRQSPPPNMLIFDAPTREMCVARRPRTSTPLQALALLNDPQFVSAAESFGRRMIQDGGADSGQRLEWGFKRATGRIPTPREKAVLENVLEKQNGREENYVWTAVASLLLNLDETITKN